MKREGWGVKRKAGKVRKNERQEEEMEGGRKEGRDVNEKPEWNEVESECAEQHVYVYLEHEGEVPQEII